MKRLSFLLAAACLLAASCTSNIDVFLPRGEDGTDGKDGRSAYELWLESVVQGVDNPHTDAADEWPRDATSVRDYYDFLSGLDGKDGAPGSSSGGGGGTGQNGNDGAPGKSAWELWVDDVTDANGLDNHHTPAVGDEWPRTETSLADFWRYLTGDNSSSSGAITNPGTNGPNITPIAGKPNVIALYTDQAHSEYVNVETGAVTYQVWKDDQTKAGAGVSVSGLPRVSGTFTTLSDGTFTVAASQLPTLGDVASRFGSVTVDGAPSAINTYVPQKVETRLVIGYGNNDVPTLGSTNTQTTFSGGAYMDVPVKAQRRTTSEGAWEDIPTWITDVNRNVRAYDAQMVTRAAGDLVVPVRSTPIPIRGNNAQDLKDGATVSVRRPTVEAGWLMPRQYQIDNYYMNIPGTTPEAFTLALDESKTFYGEYPHAEAMIAVAPVCFHPLPTDIVMSDLGSDTFSWASTSFNLDLLDQTRFSTTYELQMGDGVTLPFMYNTGEPTTNTRCFSLGFKKASTTVGNGKGSTFANPTYSVNENVPLDATVYFFATSAQVVGPGTDVPIGTFIEDPLNNGRYIIRAAAPFTFPDITITLQ